MAQSKTAKKSTKGPTRKPIKGFTDEEKSAMRARVRELQGVARKEKDEGVLLEAIAGLQPQDRALAERVHAIIRASAPELSPTTWYGMPAYARDGKIVCHFQPAQKFKTRYASLGFSDKARLDEGAMWPVAYALTTLTSSDEATIGALVKKALG